MSKKPKTKNIPCLTAKFLGDYAEYINPPKD